MAFNKYSLAVVGAISWKLAAFHNKSNSRSLTIGNFRPDINKDIYLESDYLVYPLHQSLDKKGLLICEYPNEPRINVIGYTTIAPNSQRLCNPGLILKVGDTGIADSIVNDDLYCPV